MKRVIPVLLVCMLVLPLCMVTAFAADTGYSFAFVEDFGDSWDVVGDNIPDGMYMVEYWMDDMLCAYTSPFEYKKENCINRWGVGVFYSVPLTGVSSNGSIFISYIPSEDKIVVTVPDPCSFDSVDTPDVDVRFVPQKPESPERLVFHSFDSGMYGFLVPGLLESGVYTFYLRTPGFDVYYRTEPVELSFTVDPQDPYGQIADAETYFIVEGEKVPVILAAFTNKDHSLLGLGLGFEEYAPLYVDMERLDRTDSENDSVVNQLSTVANSFFETIGRIAEKIVSEPLLLLTVGIFFIGGCIAIFARFLRRE